MADAPASVTRRRLPRWELAALVLCAVAGLAFQWTVPSRLARDEDYRAVAQRLEAEAQPGDAVVLFPWWTERARLFLPEALPIIGYLHSEQADLMTHPRLWLLSEPHLPRAGARTFDAAFSPGREPLGPVRHLGNLDLQLFRNGRARPVLFSAVDQLAQAHVSVEGPDGTSAPCAWDGQTHQCPGGLHVAAEWHELFYEPRRCLWMAPPGGGQRLVVSFEQVPAGSALLEGGIVWENAVRKDVSPAVVGVDGLASRSREGGFEVAPGVEGLQHATWDRPAGGLKVWSQSDRPDARALCVELHVFGPATAAPARGSP